MRKEATPAVIALVVRVDPDMALVAASDEWTDNQVAICAARRPSNAIVFVWIRMTIQQRDQSLRRAPAMALRLVAHELTPEQFRECASRAPRAAEDPMAQFNDPDRSPCETETEKHSRQTT